MDGARPPPPPPVMKKMVKKIGRWSKIVNNGKKIRLSFWFKMYNAIETNTTIVKVSNTLDRTLGSWGFDSVRLTRDDNGIA